MRTKNHTLRRLISVFGSGLLLGISEMSFAGGLALPEQSVTFLGTSFAGTASYADDATTNFQNAAGLTRLKGEQIIFGAFINIPQTKLNVDFATNSAGVSIGGGSTRPSNNAVIPSFHY